MATSFLILVTTTGTYAQQINNAGKDIEAFLGVLHAVQQPLELTAAAGAAVGTGLAIGAFGVGIIAAGCSGTAGIACPPAVAVGIVSITSGSISLYGGYQLARQGAIPAWLELFGVH